MTKLTRVARMMYCIGLAGMVLPKFYYRKFGDEFLPDWPGLPLVPFWACLFAVIALAACVAIFLDIRGRAIALILAGLLLAMIIFGWVTYELLVDPGHNRFINWAGVLSGLALTGGAFVVAGTLPEDATVKKSPVLRWLEKLIPFGNLFFCITIVGYGYTHFLYPDMILTLFPSWILFQMFWTYFAGVALILGGFAIVFHIKVKLAGILLGVLLLIFLVFIHIPLAIGDPWSQNAFQFIRVFGALAFSGTAFMIAGNSVQRIAVRER
jgi:uncharacterized membrane protein YphA (DoxX/SURF4 family)